jgi:hypothetical protein
MVASMKFTVFWVLVLCSLVEVYRSFLGVIALTVEAASTSETSVNFCQATQCNNPEDSHLQAWLLPSDPGTRKQ